MNSTSTVAGRLGRLLLAVPLLLGLLGSPSARASAVSYSFDVQINSLCEWSGALNDCSTTRGGLSTGSVYRGHFAVDESALATEGQTYLNDSTAIQSLDFQLSSAAWHMVGTDGCVSGFFEDPSALACTPNLYYWNMASPTMGWGLQVQDGELHGISGGMYAAASSWFGFVTNPDGSSFFASVTKNYVEGGYTYATGSVTVNRVPEPATLGLVIFALSTMPLVSGARRRRVTRQA